MLARQLILGFGILVVVPMVIHNGVDLIVDRPDPQEMLDMHRRSFTDNAEFQERMAEAQASFQEERKHWSWIHLVVGAPLGIAVMIGGWFIALPVITEGLMLGGIVAFSSNCFWYWGDLPAFWRFSVMLLALASLLWVSHRSFGAPKAPAGAES